MEKTPELCLWETKEDNVPGCVANGIDEAVANKIYDEMTDFKHIAEGNFAVDDHTYKETVYNGYGCCFCWCEDTAVDTAQNDDRHQESPESIFKSVPAFFA